MAEEKRDELEKLIEAQKAKKPKVTAPKEEIPPPIGEQPTTTPQMPASQPAPAGFTGMQTSMMEEPTGAPQMPEMPPSAIPQQPMPQPQAPMPQPQMQPEAPIPEPQMPIEPEEEMATMPSLPVAQLAYNRTNIEEIEALIESVVEEKWRQAMESFQDFNLWKEKARTEIISVKQEIVRLTGRFENLEKAMIGRVQEYDSHVLNIGAEIKAIEKVMQKIVQPLSANVKELERITKKFKQ